MGVFQDPFSSGAWSQSEPWEQRKARERVESLYKLQEKFYAQQQELAERQNRYVMESLGYTFDPNTGEFTEGPQTPEQQRAEEIMRLMQQRQIAALEGTAPVDPALEQDIAEAEARARQQAAFYGGDESTAGRKIMSSFYEWANIARSNARSGEITGSFQNILGQTGVDLQRSQQILGGLQGLTGAYQDSSAALSGMGQTAGVLGGMASQPSGFNWGAAGSLAGGVIGGMYGGPFGAYVGSQAGGMAGSYFGGGTQQQQYGYYPSWQRHQGGGYRPVSPTE